MRNTTVPALAALLLALSTPARAADSAQRDPRLYQLDKQLQRRGCDVPATSPVTPTITLDGSGRYVDLIATQSKPAYWTRSLPEIQIQNVPTEDLERRSADADNLMVRAQTGGAAPLTFTREIGVQQTIPIRRDEIAPFESGGVVQLEVLRHGLVISTLWLILREPDVILLSDDGPVDPTYKNTLVPGYMPCDFQLEYAPRTPSAAPPLVIVAPASQPSPKFAPIALNALETATVHWADLAALRRDDRDDVQLVVLKNGRAASVLWLTKERRNGFRPIISIPQPPAGAPASTGSLKIEVLLDRLGVASPRFLNQRRPAYIPATTQSVALVFTSIAPDRAFVVTFSNIPESERAELVRSGVRMGACRNDRCTAAVRVPPGGSIEVPANSLRNAYAKSGVGSTVTFDVAFFDVDSTPTNSRGYLTFVDEPFFTEPASTTTWTGALSVSLLNDPDLSATVPDGRSAPLIDVNHPWGRSNRTHVSGSATIGLKQNMGNRADFEAELTAKNGDFGQDASPLQSSKFLANVYTDYGATLTGGRFDLAAPTNAIAFSESGDAVSFGGRLGRTPAFGSIGYVFRKALPLGSFNMTNLQKAIQGGATSLDRSNQDIVLQLRDVAAGRVRAAFYGVIGDADRGRLETGAGTLTEFDASYWTAGGEAIVTMGNTLASLGIYHSERSNEAPETVKLPDDSLKGDASLLSVSYTNVDRAKIQGNQLATHFSLTAQVGKGGSYVGESQAFTPDLLFLSRLAGAIVDPAAPIGAGLVNKWYYGLVATTPRLDWLSLGRGVATVKLHHYRRTEPRAGSQDLGTEASLEVRIEQPKGVRYQLTLAGFQPGGALNPSDDALKLITRFQYLFKFNVTVRIE